MKIIDQKNGYRGPRPQDWWTGPQPGPGTPGFSEEGILRSLPQIRIHNISRQDILNYFDNSWMLTEVLFSSLNSPEAFVRPPAHGLRHPLIFYYAHPAVLYVNKLRVAGLLKAPVRADFEDLFEVGVDEMSWDDMSKNERVWPAVQEVTEYRRWVYQKIRSLILEDPRLSPEPENFQQKSPGWALIMGFEHERIHLETSAVLIRELPLTDVQVPQYFPPLRLEPVTLREPILLSFAQTEVHLGKPFEDPTFGWDNEYGSRTVTVPAFEVTQSLISNFEFLQFVKSGAYSQEEFWSREGWQWRSFRNTKAPTFWRPQGPAGLHQYKLRTLFSEIELPLDWPALVNFHEAQAYARWQTRELKSKTEFRLLSEAEHHVLRKNCDSTQDWNWGLKFGHETSVGNKKSDDSLTKPLDVFGNAWQWCEDEFNPLPGFKVHPFYEDFSTPCFDGKHHMIMGGSFASTGDEASPFARFHFRPHFFQFSGFRLARSLDPMSPRTGYCLSQSQNPSQVSDYQSQELLSQYLLLHYADPKDVLLKTEPVQSNSLHQLFSEALSFPRQCATQVLQTAQSLQIPMHRALDLGCAVGGASFALSESFDHVVGLDLSGKFIEAAQEIKNRGFLHFQRKDQGMLSTPLTIRRPALSRPEKVEFHEADASEVPVEFREFDAVLMANLLCRLREPHRCLQNMSEKNIVKRGGLLALASPYSWLAEHTPESQWLGGRIENGERLRSSDAIKRILNPNFELIEEKDQSVLIREHERKYQFILTHWMLWRRKQ